MKIIGSIVKAFHKWRLRQDFKIAKKYAIALHKKTGKKYFVLYIQGNFKPVEKQAVKQQLRQGGFFRKGVNMRTVEQYAYFITD